MTLHIDLLKTMKNVFKIPTTKESQPERIEDALNQLTSAAHKLDRLNRHSNDKALREIALDVRLTLEFLHLIKAQKSNSERMAA